MVSCLQQERGGEKEMVEVPDAYGALQLLVAIAMMVMAGAVVLRAFQWGSGEG